MSDAPDAIERAQAWLAEAAWKPDSDGDLETHEGDLLNWQEAHDNYHRKVERRLEALEAQDGEERGKVT